MPAVTLPPPATSPAGRLAVWGTVLAVTALATLASRAVFSGVEPADMRALWLAGQAFAEGRLDQIYPPDDRFFTMIPPAGWAELAARQGYAGPVYPFIYPPLWAALSAWLVAAVPPAALDTAVRIIAPVLVAALVVLAHRLTRTRVTLMLALPATLVYLALLPAVRVALAQGQPQILVAVLVLWALEREEAGHPRAAGGLLALAAALKVYPALLALLWIGARRWPAVRAFLVAGAVLAATSVALAGWPLHAAFLRLLAVISDTTMVTRFTYSIGSALTQITGTEALFTIDGTSAVPGAVRPGALAGETPGLLRVVGAAGTLFSLALGSHLLRRAPTPRARAAVWAAVMFLTSLFGPISWGYHYLAPLALFVMLGFDRPPMRGLLPVIGVGALLLRPLWTGIDLGGLVTPESVIATLGLTIAALLCLTWRRDRA